jgi:hypothetical protein
MPRDQAGTGGSDSMAAAIAASSGTRSTIAPDR